MEEETFSRILDDALGKQLEDIFSRLGNAVGYDLGDEEEVKNIRKDLWMLRATRQRSERFKAIGEKIFFMFFWGTIGSAFVYGGIVMLKEKLGIK